jgi:hypothetical protein
MRRRRITIEGNRYLIFYTFDDEPRLGATTTGNASATNAATGTTHVAASDDDDKQIAAPQTQSPTDARDTTRQAEGEQLV